jgi:DNA repair protein RecO (recombination protein O)
MRSQMLFARGRNLDIITQAELVEAYRPLREDLIRVTYASHLVELLDRFTVEHDAHPELYHLLADALGWLTETPDLLLTARYVELRLLGMVGYQPRLFQCAHCSEVIEPRDQFFSAELGGVLCPNCQRADDRAEPISLAALKVVRYMQTRPYGTVRRLKIRRTLHAELETLMFGYLQHLLERRLQSADFLRRLRQEAEVAAR